MKTQNTAIGILEAKYGAHYARLIGGNDNEGTVECVIGNMSESDTFFCDGYNFCVTNALEGNTNGEDVESEDAVIDTAIHDVYTIEYCKHTEK